jgi:trimethylamine corrinoid protein
VVEPTHRQEGPIGVPAAVEVLETARREYDRAVFETNKEAAQGALVRALDAGATPETLVFDVIIPSLQASCDGVGAERNLAQHFMTSLIACEASEEMVRRFKEPPEKIGRAVIGTASGDYHGLGARIVAGCLRASMIDVVDLGRDVPPERFLDEAAAAGAQVICVSSMMLHTARGDRGPAAVRRLLHDRGLEDDIRLAVGGAPYTYDPRLYRVVGADDWAASGLAAGGVVARLIREVRR